MTDVDPRTAGEPAVIVAPDADVAARFAAERIADVLAAAVATRGRADFATTGGSSPVGIYRFLASDPLRGRVPWESVQLWWGDDRFVPRDHRLSNVLPCDTILLSVSQVPATSGNAPEGPDGEAGLEPGIWMPPGNVHPFRCGEAIANGAGPEWAAVDYVRELRASGIRIADGWPQFDLVLLGLGPDGHVLSVFPGSAAFDTDAWALAIPAPTHIEPHVPRVTLNPHVLGVADEVLVVATGDGKADAIGRVFGTERDPRQVPGLLARRATATWILDEAAAAALPPGATTA